MEDFIDDDPAVESLADLATDAQKVLDRINP